MIPINRELLNEVESVKIRFDPSNSRFLLFFLNRKMLGGLTAILKDPRFIGRILSVSRLYMSGHFSAKASDDPIALRPGFTNSKAHTKTLHLDVYQSR
jgi:hypothetical protein